VNTTRRKRVLNSSGLDNLSRGFTLIELLISLIIGIIVISAASSLLQTSARTRNIVRHTAFLQEQAFFTTHTLRQQLSQTGYRGIDPALIGGHTIPVGTHSSTFPAVPGEWDTGQLIRVRANVLSYRFAGGSASDGSVDNSIYDCAGNALVSGPIYEAHISLLANRLVCSIGAQNTTLLGSDENVAVEQIAYLLGVDNDNDNIIDAMVTPAAATATDFFNTRHITIRLLTATQNNNVSHKQKYRFNGVETQATDNRLRNEIVVSVALRN